MTPSTIAAVTYKIGGAALPISFTKFTADPASCEAGLQYAVTFDDDAIDPYVNEDFTANTLTVEAAAGTVLTAKDYAITITATTALSAAIPNASMAFILSI